MSLATTNAKRRVKLFASNASRQWADKGTGHVTSCYHEPLDGMSLLVRNESDGSLLLESKIQLDIQYQKRQGTLIVWTESDNYDIALSFQERYGCEEIWEKICQVQGRDPSYEQEDDNEGWAATMGEEITLTLVDCVYDKLHEILDQITEFSTTTCKKDMLALEYINNDYISKLLSIFKQADETQDLPTLYKLYEIFKQLFLYDRPTLTDHMLGETFLMDIIGVFEYKPPQTSDSVTQPQRHREFLKNVTTFREVIPFCTQKLADKIHHTYRVQYLQSSVLPAPSILEENAYNALANILFFNKVEIVSMIQDNGEFLQSLFNQIISNETGTERKQELVLFLREYCVFSQTMQPKQRESFFKTLTSLEILSAVEVALSSNDRATKSAAIDIFTHLVLHTMTREYNPNMTRGYAVQQKEGLMESPDTDAQETNILKLVIEHLTTDQDPELGTPTQLSCIIKLLLDPKDFEKLRSLGLDKTPFIVVSVLGQELLAKNLINHAAIILESALKLDSSADKKYKSSVISSITLAFCMLKEYDKAIVYMQRELEIETELEDIVAQCKVLGNLGYTHFKLGRFDKSLEAHRKQLSLAMKSNMYQQASLAFNAIGHVHVARNDFPNALTSHTRCLDILRQLAVNDFLQFKEILSIGHVCSMMNDIKTAEERYEEANHFLNNNRCKLNIEEFTIGLIMHRFNMAHLSLKKSDFRGAQKYYKEVIQLARELSKIDHKLGALYEMRSCHGMGHTFRLLKRFEDARSLFKQQLHLSKMIGDQSGQSQALCNLGMTCQHFKEYTEAKRYFEENLRLVDKNPLLKAYAHSYMGSIHFLLGHSNESRAHYENSLSIFNEHDYCVAEKKTIDLNMAFVHERMNSMHDQATPASVPTVASTTATNTHKRVMMPSS